jgi:uncharacterized membrane protein YhaH (DUF805 family)
VNAYVDALLRYFSFSGRSTRSQFWQFQLVALLMMIIAIEVDVLRGDQFRLGHYGLVATCVILFHFIPQFTIAIRRLHDIGKSGWWWLIALIPFGGFFLLYWQCKASEPGSNDYGDDPHDAPPREPAPTAPNFAARLPTLSRQAPVAARRTLAGSQPPSFGTRGRPAA